MYAVIIYGAGPIGYGIAEYLSSIGCSVTLIDEDEQAITKAHNVLDVRAIQGRGSYPDLLKSIDANQADVMIAVTQYDEFNMIACQVAASLFHIPTKIAYINDLNYLQAAWAHMYQPQHMPVDYIISPEQEIARRIVLMTQYLGAHNVIPLQDNYQIVAYEVTPSMSSFVGCKANEIVERLSEYDVGVLGFERKNKFYLGNYNFILQEGDFVYMVLQEENLSKIMRMYDKNIKEARRVLLIGAGKVGSNVIKQLLSLETPPDITFVEKNSSRGLAVAKNFPNVVALQGSGLDASVLLEAGVENADVVLAVTEDDENNILSCLLARSLGAQLVYPLVNNTKYQNFLPSLGVSHMVHPQTITISQLINYVRHGPINSLHTFKESGIEICFVEVKSSSTANGMKVSQLMRPEKVYVSGIVNETGFTVFEESYILQERDKVIFAADVQEIKKLEQYF